MLYLGRGVSIADIAFQFTSLSSITTFLFSIFDHTALRRSLMRSGRLTVEGLASCCSLFFTCHWSITAPRCLRPPLFGFHGGKGKGEWTWLLVSILDPCRAFLQPQILPCSCHPFLFCIFYSLSSLLFRQRTKIVTDLDVSVKLSLSVSKLEK